METGIKEEIYMRGKRIKKELEFAAQVIHD